MCVWGRQSSSWRGQGRRCKGAMSQGGWSGFDSRGLLLKKKTSCWYIGCLELWSTMQREKESASKKGEKPARGAHNTYTRPLHPRPPGPTQNYLSPRPAPARKKRWAAQHGHAHSFFSRKGLGGETQRGERGKGKRAERVLRHGGLLKKKSGFSLPQNTEQSSKDQATRASAVTLVVSSGHLVRAKNKRQFRGEGVKKTWAGIF